MINNCLHVYVQFFFPSDYQFAMLLVSWEHLYSKQVFLRWKNSSFLFLNVHGDMNSTVSRRLTRHEVRHHLLHEVNICWHDVSQFIPSCVFTTELLSFFFQHISQGTSSNLIIFCITKIAMYVHTTMNNNREANYEK